MTQGLARTPQAIDTTSLSAVVVVGAGTSEDTLGGQPFSMIVVAASVSTGGTVELEGSPDDTNWVTLATRAITASGTYIDTVDVPIRYIRANLTIRTDGTYTAFLQVPPSGGERLAVDAYF